MKDKVKESLGKEGVFKVVSNILYRFLSRAKRFC